MKPTKLPGLESKPISHLQHPAAGTPHTHVDKDGFLVDCYHSTRNVLTSASFWIGVTISFPIEHLIWSVWPLSVLWKMLGI